MNLSSPKTTRLLLVEDDQEYASFIQLILARSELGKFEISLANLLQNAIQLLQHHTYDIILLDLILPDSPGHETFSKIYAYASNTPIVVLTALDDHALAINAMREGAQDYLVKGEMATTWMERSLLYAIERYRSWAMLQQLSLQDDLTGLFNRRGFYSLAAKHINIAQRTQAELLLLFADLDHLKEINDLLGHLAGDNALRSVANILRKTFRTSDIIARVGGDEFLVLAIITPQANPDAILARLEENLSSHNAQNPTCPISLSYGVIRFDPKAETSLEEVVAQADFALYQCKQEKDAKNK